MLDRFIDIMTSVVLVLFTTYLLCLTVGVVTGHTKIYTVKQVLHEVYNSEGKQ